MFTDRIKRYGIKGTFLKFIFKSFSLFGIDYDRFICLVFFTKENTEMNIKKIDQCIELNEECFVKYGDKDWFSQKKLEDIRHAYSIPGNKAFGIIQNDRLICYAWLSLQFWGGDITRKLQSQDAYFWDDYVHPSYRGQKLHTVLINTRLHYLQKLGKERVFTVVSIYNQASYKGFNRLGFIKWQTYFVLKLKWNNRTINSFRYE